MYPATHDGSRYSSHWILTLSSLHLLVSSFALLKASVNSRDTLVNNYPPVYFCVLGGRENFENTQLEAVTKAKYNNICHSWKILPITFHLIQFLGGKKSLFSVPIGFARFDTDLTFEVQIKIGAFQDKAGRLTVSELLFGLCRLILFVNRKTNNQCCPERGC